MSRKDLQHIQLQQLSKDKEASKASSANYLTAEAINLKQTYSAKDIADLGHINFVAGIAPNLRGPYSTMYVRRPWTIRQY
ncbi:MAG: methylmalonyl-CoA mutase, partial [Bacteroidia bacterium]|nr:methylmalonyl-CoA mutase [Bacteroidia bacterium]